MNQPVVASGGRDHAKEHILYNWTDERGPRAFALARVVGTGNTAYGFGTGTPARALKVREFFFGVVPVTQSLWQHVTGSNPALHRHPDLPVENVSWDHVTQPGGFLQQLNERVAGSLREQAGGLLAFRLPSEAEWEYAARGGPSWRDGFPYSGSDDINAVAWYDRRHGDHTQPVAQKSPNQLGLFDMSGNVWEWCEDTFALDTLEIPTDGTPYVGRSDERVLRGGCFHNWAEHCTVTKRYEIGRGFHDGCIGVRLVLAEPR